MAGVQDILNQAMALGEQERWEEMAELLAGSLDDSPDEPYFLCWLGVAEQELGNDGMAYEYFRRCIAQEPLDPHLLALAGSGLAMFDDPEAEAVLRAAALSAPELPIARLQYGAYLARHGLFDEAREHLRAAAELAPDDPAVHSEFACALALEDQFENAAGEMERALELAPEDAWSRLLLGLFYTELGQLEDGAEQLIQAAEEREDDAEAHILAALAAAAVGWEDAAHASITRAGYRAEGSDAAMASEAEERILSGSAAAEAMLLETIGPSVLRERLMQPL